MGNNDTHIQAGIRIDRLPRIVRYQYWVMVVLFLGYFFEFFDLWSLSYIAPNVAADFNLSDTEVGFLLSAVGYGMFVGAIFMGWLSDTIGRKKAFVIALAIFSIFTILTGFAWNLTDMIIYRMISGFGLGGGTAVCSAYLSEFFPSRIRGKVMNIAFGLALSPPSTIAALMAYTIVPITGWRFIFFFGGAMGLPIYILQKIFLPESPRWLQSKGRWDEADEILSELEREAGITTPSSASTATVKVEHFSLNDLFGNFYLKRTIVIWIIWLLTYIAGYGFGLWLPSLLMGKLGSQTGLLVAMVISLFMPAGALFSASITEKYGRKTLMIWAYLSLTIILFIFGYQEIVWLIVLLGALYNIAMGVRVASEYAYTPEIYPTRARSTAFGMASSMGRLGIILGPVIVSNLYTAYGYAPVFIFNGFLYMIVCLTVFLFAMETKGIPLEELAK